MTGSGAKLGFRAYHQFFSLVNICSKLSPGIPDRIIVSNNGRRQRCKRNKDRVEPFLAQKACFSIPWAQGGSREGCIVSLLHTESQVGTRRKKLNAGFCFLCCGSACFVLLFVVVVAVALQSDVVALSALIQTLGRSSTTKKYLFVQA
jgi:hypothetical protein